MINNIKIAVLGASLRGGGAERVIVTLANYLSDYNYQAELILVSKEGPYLKEIQPGIKVVDLKKKRVVGALWPLIKYLKAVRPDILISTMGHVNVIAILAKCLARARVKLIVREVTIPSLIKTYSKGIKSRLISFFIGQFYPLADRIVAVSKGVAKDLKANFKIADGKVIVIYDPVVNEDVLQKAGEAVNHPWFNMNSIPIVLAAGRLSKEKDYPTLLRAFNILSKRKEVRLVILGEGLERKLLETMIRDMDLEDRVSMPGFVENPYSFMHQAAVFVVSSTVEGLSNVLVQAMAVGTPVVSTDCPYGPAEVLENGKFGPLVPVGDAEALAEALYSVLTDPLKPEFLQKGISKFTVAEALNSYTAAIDSLLKA